MAREAFGYAVALAAMMRLTLIMATLLAGRSLAQQAPDFYRDVEPILAKNCLACHQASFAAGGLQLDSAGGVLNIVVPGNAGRSLLIQRVESTDKRMPPSDALTHEQIAAIRKWIDRGAKIEPAVDFATQALPILRDSCWSCHGGENPKGGLQLDSREGAMKGGIGGAIILPGNSKNSPMIQWLVRDGKKKMPAAGMMLGPDQISVLTRWIDQGAKWPDEYAGAH